MFPIQAQAKRAIWNGLDNDGRRFIDAFPPDRIVYRNETDLFLRFDTGSTYQMLGSDRFNAHVGANTRGIVISEWALCNPAAWAYFRPIIRANKGWVLFITTYRGRNHAWQMVQGLSGNPNWFVKERTVLQTHKHDGTPIISEADVQADRDEGMSEELIQSEYFLNPRAALEGTIYGRQHQGAPA